MIRGDLRWWRLAVAGRCMLVRWRGRCGCRGDDSGDAGGAERGGDSAGRCSAGLFADGDACRNARWGSWRRSFAALEAMGAREFAGKKFEVERTVDVRYVGQGYELNVSHGADAAERFHATHEQRYGFANRERGLEIVNVRVRVRCARRRMRRDARRCARAMVRRHCAGEKSDLFRWGDG